MEFQEWYLRIHVALLQSKTMNHRLPVSCMGGGTANQLPTWSSSGLFTRLHNPWKDNRRLVLGGKYLCNTVQEKFFNWSIEVKAPSAESSACVHRAADWRAVGAVQMLPKLNDNMRQETLYADRHILLERYTSCQELNVNNEDVTCTTCPSGISYFGLYTSGCDRRSNAHSISGLTISIGIYLL